MIDRRYNIIWLQCNDGVFYCSTVLPDRVPNCGICKIMLLKRKQRRVEYGTVPYKQESSDRTYESPNNLYVQY